MSGDERILLADDHTLVSETVAAYLKHTGDFAVATVSTQPAACAAIRANGPFALVLTEWQMAGMDGPAGLAELIALNGAGTVAVLTGTVDRRTAAATIAAGAIGYLPKTLSAGAFLAALRLMLSGKVYTPAWPPADPRQALLSPRERQVLEAVCRGLPNKEIAATFGVAEVTVKLHVRALCRKLDARNRTQIALIARDAGLC